MSQKDHLYIKKERAKKLIQKETGAKFEQDGDKIKIKTHYGKKCGSMSDFEFNDETDGNVQRVMGTKITTGYNSASGAENVREAVAEYTFEPY